MKILFFSSIWIIWEFWWRNGMLVTALSVPPHHLQGQQLGKLGKSIHTVPSWISFSTVLPADPSYPPVWMTEGRLICLTPLSPLTGGRWQMEVGTPSSTLEVSLGGPTAPRATCWRSSIMVAAPPPQWAGSFLLTPLLMVSLRPDDGQVLLW